MPLRNFLNLVLPNEGFKCWIEIPKSGRPIQGLVATAEELAVKLLEIDSRGVDAYFACAVYKTPQNRRAGNALGAKTQWSDLDVGEGKPYATIEEAVQACDDFCNRVSIPLPGLVRSGGGLHAYWVFDEMLPAADWIVSAQRFKLLAAAHGFHADSTRTADISSILRPPGTKNYKLSVSREVALYDGFECFEPFPSSELTRACINIPSQVATEIINKPSNLNASLSAGMRTSKAFDLTVGAPEGGGEHGGRDRACTVLAGEYVAKSYPIEQVMEICLKWNQLNTPPMPESQVRKCVNSIARKHIESHPLPPVPHTHAGEVATAMPQLPPEYAWSADNKLIITVKNEGGADIVKVVSNLPVYLRAMMNEEGHGQKNSYLFSQYHSLKGWQEFTMNAKDFNGQSWYGAWVENGGSIVAGADKYFKDYVRRATDMLKLPGKELTRYSQFGWKENDQAFLVGDNLCKSDGTVEKAYGTDKLTPLMHVMKPTKQGSLADWTSAANKLFMPGMEAHAFMLLTSFAAAVMKFCVDEGNGGSILSIVSEDSGHGKTPMATAMASVWGELQSTVVTGNFTENRRIEDLVRHCHLPQVQEEMAYSDPMIAATGIEKFTSGSDRGRLDKTGAAGGIPERYQTIVVSISNKSLYDLVRMVNIPMSRRVFEIEIERPEDGDIANLGGIVREMMRNSGHAGLQFSRLIVNPEIQKYISYQLRGEGVVGATQLKYRQILQSQPEHRFIVWPLASVDIVARILVQYGLLHFDVERIMAWAITKAKDRISEVPQHGDSAAKLDKFLTEHIDNCLTVSGPYQAAKGAQVPLRVPRGRLCMRLEMHPARLYITSESLQAWCSKRNISFIGLGKKLVEAKIVVERSKMVALSAGTDIASGRTLCWEVDMTHPAMSGQVRLAMCEEPKDKAALV